ncbi:MAG TPA: hypothetical protein VFQ88_07370 [Nevskiaceae bacterium]|nr:hypothetical protein [Nevskiaceae bacterium]
MKEHIETLQNLLPGLTDVSVAGNIATLLFCGNQEYQLCRGSDPTVLAFTDYVGEAAARSCHDAVQSILAECDASVGSFHAAMRQVEDAVDRYASTGQRAGRDVQRMITAVIDSVLASSGSGQRSDIARRTRDEIALDSPSLIVWEPESRTGSGGFHRALGERLDVVCARFEHPCTDDYEPQRVETLTGRVGCVAVLSSAAFFGRDAYDSPYFVAAECPTPEAASIQAIEWADKDNLQYLAVALDDVFRTARRIHGQDSGVASKQVGDVFAKIMNRVDPDDTRAAQQSDQACLSDCPANPRLG